MICLNKNYKKKKESKLSCVAFVWHFLSFIAELSRNKIYLIHELFAPG